MGWVGGQCGPVSSGSSRGLWGCAVFFLRVVCGLLFLDASEPPSLATSGDAHQVLKVSSRVLSSEEVLAYTKREQ